MTFLTPWSALVAAAVAIPLLVLLYVLRLRRQRLRIASTLLWQKSFEDLQANVPFQRLRWSPLLALQLLMLMLMLLAFAQPVYHGESATASRIILLIDHSASMGAAAEHQSSGISTRLDEAKRLAKQMVNALGRSDQPQQMMIIAFASTPSIVSTYESNRGALNAAIDSIQPTDEQADLEAALQLAGAYSSGVDERGEGAGTDISGGGGPEVVLLSDGCFDGTRAGSGSGGYKLRAGHFRFINVALDETGQRSEVNDQRSEEVTVNNLGITAFSVRRDIDDPARVLVFSRLTNAGPTDIDATVTLFINGAAETTLRRRVPAATNDAPGEDAFTHAVALTNDAVLTLRLTNADDLPSDNTASLVLPAPRPPRLALVHPDGLPHDPFLHELLSALEPGELRIISAVAFANLDAQAIDAGDVFDLIVLDRVALPRWPAVATLSFGPPAPVNQPPPGGADERSADDGQRSEVRDQRSDETTGRRVLSWDRQHPLMRQVSLDTIVYAGFTGFDDRLLANAQISGGGGGGSGGIAFGPDGPIIIEVRSRGTRHVIVGFELFKSNWPLHISSAVFIQNALDYLTPARLSATGLAYHAGEPITVRANPDATSITIKSPEAAPATGSKNESPEPAVESGGSSATADLRLRPIDITVSTDPGSMVTLPAIRRAGLYVAEGAAEPHNIIAVNVMSDVETDIRPRSSITVNAEEAAARPANAAGPQPLWPWLIAAAFALLTLEWILYCRKAAGM